MGHAVECFRKMIRSRGDAKKMKTKHCSKFVFFNERNGNIIKARSLIFIIASEKRLRKHEIQAAVEISGKTRLTFSPAFSRDRRRLVPLRFCHFTFLVGQESISLSRS